MNAVSLPQDPVRRVLDHLTTAVLLVGDDGRIVYMNPAAEDLFGWSQHRAERLRLDEVPVDGGTRSLADCLVPPTPDSGSYTHREIVIKPPATDERVVNCTVTRLPPEDGAAWLVELTRVDRILKIALEEQLLAQQLTAREIARGLAHEINNPLGGLRGAAQLLERTLPESEREYTRIIISEADRLQKLVQRILGPHSLPNKGWTNIHEVACHVMKLVRAESGDAVRFAVDFDPSIPELWADRDQLVQALLNIVRNAWQAVGGEGCITLRTRVLHNFTIGQRRHRRVLRVDVVDDGPGIPEDKIKQIFYPMVTGRAEGSGLGLTIAQTLINLHGGLIECTSRPGCTTFTLLLPFVEPDVTPR